MPKQEEAESLILSDRGIAGLLGSFGEDRRDRIESLLRRLGDADTRQLRGEEVELVLRPVAYPALRSQIEGELTERLLSNEACRAAAQAILDNNAGEADKATAVSLSHLLAGQEIGLIDDARAAVQAALTTATHEGEGQ